MFRFLPEQASEIAPKIDWVNNLVTDLSVFFTAAIVGTMLYFAIRYRRTEDNMETPQILGNHFLELVWTVVPTVISAFVAYQGLIYYFELRAVPKDAMTINVLGKKWDWTFEYENGKKVTSELVLPVDTPVKLLMRSNDVLHSMFIPSMRVKNDVIPGRYSYVSFKPVKSGRYHIFCTEYCGKDHWNMRAELNVVSKTEFNAWVNDNSEELRDSRSTPTERGYKLFSKNCTACHKLSEDYTGPMFQGLFMKEREFQDGTKATADENYIRESILHPEKHVVKGFNNVMTAWEGLLSDKQVDDLIAFIKTLDEETVKALESRAKAAAAEAAAGAADELASMSPAERGQWHMQNNAIAPCATCHSIDGSRLVGPSYKGIFGREEKMASGETLVVDEAYIKESILNPNAKVVDSYTPAMPAYQFSDEELNDIIEYLKTLK